MKYALTLFACALFHQPAWAQLYEAESSRFQDLSTRQTRIERNVFFIDSTRLTLESGEKTYFYEVTSFVLNGAVIEMKALDLNDEEVLIRFNPQGKVLDYYLREFGIRYTIDKVTRPKPEPSANDTTASDSLDIEKEWTDADHLRMDTMVYDEVDQMPEYPGGKTEMMNYVAKNLRYPAKAKKDGIKGFVQVNAIVEKDGSIKYATVRRDLGGGTADEAIRLVKTMKWTPGYKDGDAVRVSVPITVGFMPK